MRVMRVIFLQPPTASYSLLQPPTASYSLPHSLSKHELTRPSLSSFSLFLLPLRLRKIEITPLFVAAERGHVEVVEELLRSVKDVKGVKGVKGETGKTGVKGRKGASPHIRNWNGITPLAMAAIRGHVGLVERIAAAGGQVDTEDNEGKGLTLRVSLN